MKLKIIVALAGLFLSFAAAAQMESLYQPSGDSMHCLTGWDVRSPGVPGWVKPTVYQQTFHRKYVSLAPGERFVIADLEGPGIVTRIFFTVTATLPKNNLRALVLRIYWDGEENPSVLAPLGDFFGAPFGHYREYDSMAMSTQGGGFVCRFYMPFHKSARIEVENGWPDRNAGLFYGVNYYKVESLPDDVLYFHSLWRRQNPTIKGEPFVVADLEGQGKFVGLQLFLQNRSVFVGKSFNALMQPEGFGMGNLEGWEEISVDGEMIEHGTGTEEYINAGAYFATGAYDGIFEGVHMRSYLTGRTSVYRFNILDPFPFRKNFRMAWHHGPLDVVRSDYAAVAYWYQSEPHVPQALPAFEDRMPSGTAAHAAQVIMIAPLVYGNKLVNRIVFE